jgi:hypothetical protein
MLQPSAYASEVLGPVGVSGRTLAVATFPNYDTPVGASTPDAVYVFSEPSGGWASGYASSRLIDSSGAQPQPTRLGVSQDTIVVSENSGSASNFEDVFVEPAGGWSGGITESARLVAPNAVLYSAHISGETVVVQASVLPSGSGATFVFVRPPGGWSGVIGPSAELTDRGGQRLLDSVVDGNTVVASADTHGDVFVEPARGWSGRVMPTATLQTSGFGGGAVAMAGGRVLDGPYVYSRPRSGWKGEVLPIARLYTAGPLSGYASAPAFSQTLAGFSSYSLGGEHRCPCTGRLSLFTRPVRGWSGTLSAGVALTQDTLDGPLNIALAGNQLFLSGGTAVNVYNISGSFGRRAPGPRVTRASATGLASGKPTLRLTLQAAMIAPPLMTLRLRLPAGMSFTRNRARLLKATSIFGVSAPHIALLRGVLHATVQPRRTISVTVRAPAILESGRLRRAARLGRSHLPRLLLQIEVGDQFGSTTQTPIRLH